MKASVIFCSLFIYVSSQRMPGPPYAVPVSVAPLPPYGCPMQSPYPPVVNSALGCLDPVVTPYGTIAETPVALASPYLPGACPPANPFVPAPCPLAMASPYLPAASPVSPYMPPISPYLPTASPCNNRCQYLKKIPIPPPCI